MRTLLIITLCFVAYGLFWANGAEIYYWLFPEMKATAKPVPALKHNTQKHK